MRNGENTLMTRLSDEGERQRRHMAYSSDPTYREILRVLQQVIPGPVAPGALDGPPTAQQVEAAVKVFMLLENAITWNTTCINCARLLDHSYAEYAKRKEAERATQMLASELELLRRGPQAPGDLQ